MTAKNMVSQNTKDFIVQLESLIKEGYTPTAAILFIDPRLDGETVTRYLQEKNIDCLASTSAGEISNGVMNEKTITAMFFDLPRDVFKFFIHEKVEEKSYEVGLAAANFAKANFDNPSFVLCFGTTIQGEDLIGSMAEVCGSDITIFGGMASNITGEEAPYILHNGQKYDDSVAMFIFDEDKVEIDGFSMNGWEPIGTEHTITKAKFNEIFEIDNEPALDFFYKFFGFYKDPVAMDNVSTVNSQYPFQVIRDGELVMRAPLASNKTTKSLQMAGPVVEGEKFRFSIAPSFDVIENTIKAFQEYKTTIQPPDAIVLFSCKARHWSFGPMLEREVEALHKLWEIPFTGFFTFGEIGKSKTNKTHYFNETCCLVTIREK